tara:strand:- start:221 stop:1660 length:1440 start_codon:yes stop_codon:yes gene_type:complete
MAEQRYRVVKRLEAGGMAEVFIGEAQSVQGFKKKVAIKRVLPHLAQNKNFIGMFLDEARLGARLSHANIVSVFDIGAADDTYFIVMEFVDGCNLKKIIEILRKQGRTVPFKEAIYMTMHACRGLSFAHELLSDEGEEMDIVHRDVSPPNILVSKRGEVKVTDFGLAKATTQLEKTDPGVVKGKFSYLSPEAARGENVDERADIFALGIVLWEMLAGRRLFLGETDYQTVQLVQRAEVPSLSRINAEVDAEFEAVLAKALTPDPAQRYQTAREFEDELAGYLFANRMKVTATDIASLVKSILAQDRDEAPAGQTPSNQQSIIDKLIQEELLRFTSLDDMDDPSVGGAATSPDTDGAMPLDAGLFENPADWFSDDADVAAALESNSGDEGSTPGWRESGLESLAATLEQDEPLAATRDENVGASVPPARTSSPNPPAAPAAAAPAPAPAPSGGGSSGLVIGLIVLLLAGAGAAAYFLGFVG